jgi:hypothetical protein
LLLILTTSTGDARKCFTKRSEKEPIPGKAELLSWVPTDNSIGRMTLRQSAGKGHHEQILPATLPFC